MLLCNLYYRPLVCASLRYLILPGYIVTTEFDYPFVTCGAFRGLAFSGLLTLNLEFLTLKWYRELLLLCLFT